MVKPSFNFPDISRWGVWGATSWRAIRQIWGQVEYLLSGCVAGEALPIRPDSKNLRDFARLPTACKRIFEPRTPTESRHDHWQCSNANYSATEKTLDAGVRRRFLVTRPRRKKEKCSGTKNRTRVAGIDRRTRWILSHDALLEFSLNLGNENKTWFFQGW